MRRSRALLACAALWCGPALAGPPQEGTPPAPAQGEEIKPAPAEPKAAVDVLKAQLHRDIAAHKSHRLAAEAACRTPGRVCEKAKAKVFADEQNIKADRLDLKAAYDQMELKTYSPSPSGSGSLSAGVPAAAPAAAPPAAAPTTALADGSRGPLEGKRRPDGNGKDHHRGNGKVRSWTHPKAVPPRGH